MHQFKLSALVFTSLLFATAAAAQGLQLKGKSIGMTEAQACGDAEIQSHTANIEKAGVKGFHHPANSCDVAVSSLGDLVIDSPAHLLFWNGAMVRMVIKMDRLDIQATADIRSALIDLYGQPKTQRNRPFVTDVWLRGGQTLTAEWVWSNGEPVSGSLFLTDLRGYGQFTASHNKAIKQIEALQSKGIRSNIIN